MTELTKRFIKTHTLVTSGLVGVNVVSVVQLASNANLSTSLLAAIFCFSISIPFLAATIFILTHESDSTDAFQTTYYSILGICGMFLSLGGIGALFFHFHYAAGGVFIVSSIVAIALAEKHLGERGFNKLERVPDEMPPPNNSFNRTRS